MIIIEIAGHLGADPEVRFTPNGQKVTSLRVATSTRKNGKEETVWWRVTIWGDRFDKMIPYFKKGSSIIVIGEMGKLDIYNDKEGRPQISYELTAELIRFSPFGKAEKSEGGFAGQKEQGSQEASYTSQAASGNFGGSYGGGQSNHSNQSYGGGQSTYKPSQNIPDDDNIPF